MTPDPAGHESKGSWNKESELQAASLIMNTIDAWMDYRDDKLTGNLNPNRRTQTKCIYLKLLKMKSFRL